MVVFVLICIFVVIPMIGLAIDGATTFWVKAKLSAAVDAAALAAGRSPSANPVTTAQQYVYANFPSGWMRTTYAAAPSAVVDYPNVGTRRVTVSASVNVPLVFLNILGLKGPTVAETAASSRRNSNIMLVLDRSSSMNITGPDGAVVCDTMKASAATFVDYFTNGQDQLGLITFQAWANVDFPFSTNFQTANPSLTDILSSLVCGKNTASAQALNLAYNQIKNLGSSAYASNGALNVIVFFTDGQPNGVTLGTFPAKSQTDSRYYAEDDVDPSTGQPWYSEIDSAMPATATACQTALAGAPPGTIIQGSSDAPVGLTQGIYAIPPPTQTAVCTSGQSLGQSLAICNGTGAPLILGSSSGCYFNEATTHAPTTGYAVGSSFGIRQDVAYIPLKDYYGNATVNSLYTQPSDYVTGTYASSGAMRIDTPTSVTDASFNTAYEQAQAILSDTTFKPVIYTLGLGGATDVTDNNVFQIFLKRVANDPSSDLYNSRLPTGMFVYASDDTQLQAAFHQIASQILRLTQ